MQNVYNISKADMDIVNQLLFDIKDWEKVILKRHVKFVKSYLEKNYNLKEAGKDFGFSYNDMLSVFWRIQKTLQTELDNRIATKQFNIRQRKKFKMPKEKNVVSTVNEKKIKEKVSIELVKVVGLSHDSVVRIHALLNKVANLKNYHKIVPNHLLKIIDPVIKDKRKLKDVMSFIMTSGYIERMLLKDADSLESIINSYMKDKKIIEINKRSK